MNNLNELIQLALDEDIGQNDITTEAIVGPNIKAVANIISKQDLIIAGLDVAEKVLYTYNPEIDWQPKCIDGDECEQGDILAVITGPAKDILSTERTVLNFLQHLSGIATFTNLFVKTVETTNVKILDTRKTTPGMRTLEKHAVMMGDGANHRMGLFDRYLIKENHIAIAGSITKAVELINQKRNKNLLLEIETENLDDVKEALTCKADIIMLDNMSLKDVKEAVSMVKGKTKLEVSGNITLESILRYASTGIDYISVGAITHSAPAADIHMLIESYSSSTMNGHIWSGILRTDA